MADIVILPNGFGGNRCAFLQYAKLAEYAAFNRRPENIAIFAETMRLPRPLMNDFQSQQIKLILFGFGTGCKVAL